MPCTCHHDKRNCKHCTECRDTHCRCLDCRAPLAVPLEPPEDSHKHLVRAHDAHLQALAHLELALAALDGLPTGWQLPDPGKMAAKAKEYLKKAQTTITDNVKKLGKAVYEHNKKAIDVVKRKVGPPLAKNGIVKMIANSRPGQAIAAAGSAASNESDAANAEAASHAKQFEIEKAEQERLRIQKEENERLRKAGQVANDAENAGEAGKPEQEANNPYKTKRRPPRGIM